jgi:hypothetical protein
MAVESKPLFHPEVLRQQVRSFNLPEQTGAWQPKLQHWAGLITSGRADHFKETALLPDFLTDIFCGLLGYTGPAEAADTYTLSRERHVEVDGEFADAALGRFQKGKEQFIAVLEGKGIRGKKQPLSSASLHALRDEYARTIEPARGLAAETLTLERTLSDLVNQAYSLAPGEIALMWQTAPPRMPMPAPAD